MSLQNPPRPTTLDYFFAQYQYPILMGTFATQVLHYQYIRRTQPAIETSLSTVRASSIPRPLKAGLAWAMLFAGLLTKIELSHKAVRNYSDPIIALASQRKQWSRDSEDLSKPIPNFRN